jgi:hypothetical protein
LEDQDDVKLLGRLSDSTQNPNSEHGRNFIVFLMSLAFGVAIDVWKLAYFKDGRLRLRLAKPGSIPALSSPHQWGGISRQTFKGAENYPPTTTNSN